MADLSITSHICPGHIDPDQIVPNQIVPNPNLSRPLSELLEELFHKAIDIDGKLEEWQEWWLSVELAGVIDQWQELNKKVINSKDENGCSALHKASDRGNLDMVKYLLENDAEMNLTNNFGQTPLHMAAVKKHSDVVKYLMDYASSKV